MIAVLRLAAVLAAALTAAPDTQKVLLTGVVLAERAVESATVRLRASPVDELPFAALQARGLAPTLAFRLSPRACLQYRNPIQNAE